VRVALVYPHQLFSPHPALVGVETVVLVEDPLYFKQYSFHKAKLTFHRASMKAWAGECAVRVPVKYIDSDSLLDSGDIANVLKAMGGVTDVYVCSLDDDWLEQKISRALAREEIRLHFIRSPNFLTTIEEGDDLLGSKKKLFFTQFYVAQRKRLGLLLDKKGGPYGDKWSFDSENRKRLPKGHQIECGKPKVHEREGKINCILDEAKGYVRTHFPDNPGSVDACVYPITSSEAKRWLDDFVAYRLDLFGIYEDAISRTDGILYHSVLTPMLNVGLINPDEIVAAAISKQESAPLNSIEGFIRQVIGWREYMRLVYHRQGRYQRTKNFWKFSRSLTSSLWNGTTGILPFDQIVKRLHETSYLHHIERLMIAGNFLLLCEVHPDQVYEWFMTFFIDAYDWVMVPNVYGMSQYADGGTMTTKPYISGSNYIRKMSDFTDGSWATVWDALYWRFIITHREVFASNPRMSIMVKQIERMDKQKINALLKRAESFFDNDCCFASQTCKD